MKQFAVAALMMFPVENNKDHVRLFEVNLMPIFGCLCSMPFRTSVLITEESAKQILQSWLEDLKMGSHSKYHFYIGNGVVGNFVDRAAIRFTVIIPSEYARDSNAEWDRLQIILTLGERTDNLDTWLTTKSYAHRSKGLISAESPSPDWEYASLDDADLANSRLAQIAGHLVRIARRPKIY